MTRRTLWDGGTQVQSVPALAGLHPAARLVVHPSVLADLGTADGELVRVISGRGARCVLPASGDSDRARRDCGPVPWNLPGDAPRDLIDAGAAVTDVRAGDGRAGGR